MVFAALDQVPSDLHINAIVLGVLSFFVAILMLIDLADPMARLISDTTQTDNLSINGTVQSTSITAVQNNETNSSIVKPTVVTINGHLPNGDQDQLNAQNVHRNLNPDEIIQSPRMLNITSPSSESMQQQRHHYNIHDDQISNQDQIDNITRNGNYHRNTDDIELVHAKVLPSAQQPVFEKILLPEKKRPTWQVIPDPSVSNSRTEYLQTSSAPHAEYLQTSSSAPRTTVEYIQSSSSAPPEYLSTYHQEPYRRTQHRQYHHNSAYDYDYSPPKTPEIDTRNRYSYDGKRLMVIRDYSKNARVAAAAAASSTMASNRSQDTARYSGRSQRSRNCRYDEVDEEIYDRRTAAVTTIQPGFVANAAKLWDKRAKQPDDFNTIV